MVVLPFVCLGIGLLIGLQNLKTGTLDFIDSIVNITLILLMISIGMNIGINNSVMLNLDKIGLNCIAIAISAIFFSVVFTVLLEKTILPLKVIEANIYAEHMSIKNDENDFIIEEKTMSPLVYSMPLSIITGVLLGYYILPVKYMHLLGYILSTSLVFLYIGVGISLGNNKKVFKYIKVLGMKVVYLSIAIFLGSILGGVVAGAILNLPPQISVMSASGMSYYSLTGAFMTKAYGVEIGTYGFVVNVMREFFTVISLPMLMKISKGSAIAGGASGNMDTMLMPITKFVGVNLGLVTLITGTILTFAVPFILPILYSILT